MANPIPPPVAQFFEYSHLPLDKQRISKLFGDLALALIEQLPDNSERTKCLDALLIAKDAGVRSSFQRAPVLPGPPGEPTTKTIRVTINGLAVVITGAPAGEGVLQTFADLVDLAGMKGQPSMTLRSRLGNRTVSPKDELEIVDGDIISAAHTGNA